MIHKNFKEGQKLDVAGLNEITVLIDRSETELTEVGWNCWTPNQDGPPHKHNDKIQLFYVTNGVGKIRLGNDKYDASPGSLAYVPAGLVHQTITTTNERLCYILFNVFINPKKEGHTTFADHIEKVKMIRKKQAATGNSDIDDEVVDFEIKPAKFLNNINKEKKLDFSTSTSIILLERNKTNRAELSLVNLKKNSKEKVVTHNDKELTIFILHGRGWITIGNQTERVKHGDVLFIPRNISYTSGVTDNELSYLCMGAFCG